MSIMGIVKERKMRIETKPKRKVKKSKRNEKYGHYWKRKGKDKKKRKVRAIEGWERKRNE